jgi:hypothetical protein
MATTTAKPRPSRAKKPAAPAPAQTARKIESPLDPAKAPDLARVVFGDDQPILTICIPTLETRRATFERVVAQLDVDAWGGAVELIYERDNFESTLGDKLNRLFAAAKGHYICQVDDDDEVAPDYVERILYAILTNPTVDAVTFKLIVEHDNGTSLIVNHAIPTPERPVRRFYPGEYLNPIYHICPAKAEIVKSHKFPSQNRLHDDSPDLIHILAEDVKTSVSASDDPIYFYRHTPLDRRSDGTQKRR